jgi:hypothetical protein
MSISGVLRVGLKGSTLSLRCNTWESKAKKQLGSDSYQAVGAVECLCDALSGGPLGMSKRRSRLCLWTAVREHDEAAVAHVLASANGQKQLNGEFHPHLVAFELY